MTPVTLVRGRAAPLARDDVDTDAIFPARFYTMVDGFGRALFANWRLGPDGSPDPGFVLNQPRFADPRILVAQSNFGCGSSREHAVWALQDAGIACVVASSFAGIFYDNACLSGLVAARVTPEEARALAAEIADHPDPVLEVSLQDLTIRGPGATLRRFEMAEERRRALLEGQDPIAATLARGAEIAAWREADRARRPWAWPGVGD